MATRDFASSCSTTFFWAASSAGVSVCASIWPAVIEKKRTATNDADLALRSWTICFILLIVRSHLARQRLSRGPLERDVRDHNPST